MWGTSPDVNGRSPRPRGGDPQEVKPTTASPWRGSAERGGNRRHGGEVLWGVALAHGGQADSPVGSLGRGRHRGQLQAPCHAWLCRDPWQLILLFRALEMGPLKPEAPGPPRNFPGTVTPRWG